MKPSRHLYLVVFVAVFLSIGCISMAQGNGKTVELPPPDTSGGMSLTRAMHSRQCIRSFSTTPVSMQQVAQLLWAGNGSAVDAVSGPTRTAPSAGGLYPVELYLVAGNVEELKAGIYSYDSSTHTLEMMQEGDVRSELTRAALGQYFIEEAPMTIVIAGVYERTTRKYGDRGRERYVKMDAGHAAENIFLQVTALELGTTTVGAFRDRDVKQVLGLRKAEPLYIMPVGKPEG